MDGFIVVLIVLALLVGAIVGAAGMGWAARPRIQRLTEELDDVGGRLGGTTAALATATAENRMLVAQNRDLTNRSVGDQSVLRALAPVADKLNHLQTQVGVLERDRVEQFGQLAEQLREARHSDAQLLSTTHSLTAALRSNSARGQWGEVQLRRVVEASGMLARVDFLEQATITLNAGAKDSAARPDMIVQLPGGKQLVVDAKVPLAAFLDAHELPEGSETGEGNAPGQRDLLLQQHAKALRAHIDALARKRYWLGVENTPELVVCFIPVESVLSTALRADPGLLDYAFARNVALASPVSLLTILKGAAYSWRQDVLTEHAKELFDLSRQLYDRLGTMGEHVTKLGNSLKSSVEKYNSFVGTLETRVLPTARRINDFDSASLGDSTQPAEKSGPLRVSPVETTPRLLSAAELLNDSNSNSDDDRRSA
ncbi:MULTISPECIES: DNA recombination protein RmuC [unclassified Arthrobacter]|uniref:DNA recombination protein RmuC n=1 Tax=unclassified Arthrobacter TaxID=235627 RepID=UPI0014919288|nr:MULTISPECIES: DNA recombination protein RmuC [unclassified Arthrobacter]MBE0008891.1 DNA recombination protein RmuC [Arthrobacter sp. AET 35A]NOJ62629.1 DNA recombination protein RmuC [Arthrobacter sp. 147(2020)]